MAPSPSSGFFSSAYRSPRDLALLAARAHSPLPQAAYVASQSLPKSNGASSEVKSSKFGQAQPEEMSHNVKLTQSPTWQLPAMTFRPISLTYSSTPALRPRTSEASSGRTNKSGIYSPMPKRPMSSQSRKRFSRILDIDSRDTDSPCPVLKKQQSRRKDSTLPMVAESSRKTWEQGRTDSVTTDSGSSAVCSLAARSYDHSHHNDARISQVTSHDKSTVESLLDRHIECLGLQPETEVTFEAGDSPQMRQNEPDVLADNKTSRFTDVLADIPQASNRPLTSTSQQYSSLATLDRRAMKPRRLFASMDARVPGTMQAQPLPISKDRTTKISTRLSYGWQTLPSSSQLRLSAIANPTLESGELADVDTSETKTKLRVKRRSLVSNSASEVSDLSTRSLALSKAPRTYDVHKRSKSELVARQASHRRRRLRIRLRLRTTSRTTDDLAGTLGANLNPSRASILQTRPPLPPRVSSIKSPVDGYAELSGESVPPSQTNLQSVLSRSPPIPTRWSSIIAAMPQPVKRSTEIARKASIRTQRSRRSNGSIVEPVNTSRLQGQIPRIGSVPQLAPPEFGPPLTSSDLNLSIPYAAAPSTIRPTLRETKSFFSDDSSANRQRRSLRGRLHLHSLRNVVSNSAGTSMVTHTPRPNNNLKLSYSCQIKGRGGADGENVVQDTVPMTDFAYRKRRMLEKFREWWKRQCLQKLVGGREKGQKGQGTC
jgi:hypothetical protein